MNSSGEIIFISDSNRDIVGMPTCYLCRPADKAANEDVCMRKYCESRGYISICDEFVDYGGSQAFLG
jgi:hypothetical protein